jgi:hypothetical protein
MYENSAKAAVPAMARKPTRAGMGRSSRGTTAPMTHTSWNRISNLANERPRFASGASRCTRESNASLPQVEATATVSASTADPGSPPSHAVPSPTPVMTPSTAISIRSSVIASRSRGASADPISEPAPVKPRTTPRCHVGSVRRSNRSSRVRKPTMPRIRPMADAARSTPMPRSSACSASVAGAAATCVVGIRSAATVLTK